VGDQHALLLAAREAPKAAVREALRIYVAQHLFHPIALGFGATRKSVSLRVKSEGHEVARSKGYIGVENDLLGHVPQSVMVVRERVALDTNRPAVNSLKSKDRAEQRRLSGPVGSDQPRKLSATNLEAHIIEDCSTREADGDLIDLEYGRVTHSFLVDFPDLTAFSIAATSAIIQV
jgi:hypothetical protein